MFRRFSVNFALFSISVDAALVSLSLAVASRMRPLLSYLPFIADLDQTTNLPNSLYVIFPCIWVTVFLLLAVYDGRRNMRVVDEFSNLTLGSLIAAVSLAGTLYFSYRDISRALIVSFFLLSYGVLVLWRLGARWIFRLASENTFSHRRVLIVGAGPVGRELQEQITLKPYLALHIVGFLDDDTVKRERSVDILGSLRSARQVISKLAVNDVVIALPQRAHAQVNSLVAELHDLPVKVWVIPDYFQLALHKAVIDEFAGLPMLDLRAPALNDYQRMIKRAFDLIFGVLALPPSLVIMACVALAIWLEDRGPILFRQERVGENGQVFEMLKFRTMVPNAEQLRHLVERVDEAGNLIHKSEEDPRVTRIGRFLRHTSLDELPQLINVLKGEMSLIGPRPEMPYLVEQYKPWQRKRFAVPQGITGWWQVNGRSNKPMHLHTEDDLYYVQNYSLLLDLQILFKTIGVVIRGKGAF